MLRRALLTLVSATLMACSSGYESTITYSVKVKPDDISGSTIADDEHIDTNNSQWQAFLASARAELGESPKEFDISQVRIQLDAAGSKNVGKLEDVLTGEGAIYLRTDNGGVQVDIATFEDVKGAAQVEVDVTGDDLKDVNASLASSNFRLGLRSGTPMTSNVDFEARIIVTLDVSAN